MRKLGFIKRAYEIALENSEFLPHYFTTQIREKLWNITIQSADICRKAKGKTPKLSGVAG